MNTTTSVLYAHKYEYSTRLEDGSWTEPQTRYANTTSSIDQAVKRHKSCEDVEHLFNHGFEGIYGYRWRNCELVKRTVTTTVSEEPL